MDKKRLLWSGLFALVLDALLACGMHHDKIASYPWLGKEYMSDQAFAVFIVLVFFGLFGLFYSLFTKAPAWLAVRIGEEPEDAPWAFRVPSVLKGAVAVFACWVFWIVVQYPAGVHEDAFYQIMQYITRTDTWQLISISNQNEGHIVRNCLQ